MQIIKEYCPNNNIVVIRTNCYSHTFQHISMLVDVAKSDFPNIKNEHIEVVEYGGSRYKRTFGVEFNCGDQFVPDSYESIKSLEFSI